MEVDIMRMMMRMMKSLRKLVIAYTKNETKTTITTRTLAPTHIQVPRSPRTVPNIDEILPPVLVQTAVGQDSSHIAEIPIPTRSHRKTVAGAAVSSRP
jgi:hypothetical protein